VAQNTPVGREPGGIGCRAHVIRRHRGLSLDVVAGLVRFTKGCLSVDRDTADALAGLQGHRVALHDYGPDDVPDVRPGRWTN
jgi:hypothetical protein